MVQECPKCGLVNPPEAARCDCGYDFLERAMRQSYLAQSRGPQSGGGPLDAVERLVANYVRAQVRSRAGRLGGLLFTAPAICCLIGAIEADSVAPPTFRDGFRWLCGIGAVAYTVAAAALVLWLDDKARFLERWAGRTRRCSRPGRQQVLSG
jgi:hypothetical protein